MYFNNAKYDSVYTEINKQLEYTALPNIKESLLFSTLKHATKALTISHCVQHWKITAN